MTENQMKGLSFMLPGETGRLKRCLGVLNILRCCVYVCWCEGVCVCGGGGGVSSLSILDFRKYEGGFS